MGDRRGGEADQPVQRYRGELPAAQDRQEYHASGLHDPGQDAEETPSCR